MKPRPLQQDLWQMSNREMYRGYEIAKCPGLFPYAVIGDAGIVTLRPTLESARARIDQLAQDTQGSEAVALAVATDPDLPEPDELPDEDGEPPEAELSCNDCRADPQECDNCPVPTGL